MAPSAPPDADHAPLTLDPPLLPAGRIARGAPADLVLCDLSAPQLIDADKLVSKSKNSPFDGRTLQGRVLRTVVDGRTVYDAE